MILPHSSDLSIRRNTHITSGSLTTQAYKTTNPPPQIPTHTAASKSVCPYPLATDLILIPRGNSPDKLTHSHTHTKIGRGSHASAHHAPHILPGLGGRILRRRYVLTQPSRPPSALHHANIAPPPLQSFCAQRPSSSAATLSSSEHYETSEQLSSRRRGRRPRYFSPTGSKSRRPSWMTGQLSRWKRMSREGGSRVGVLW